jgi:hypothetical protein
MKSRAVLLAAGLAVLAQGGALSFVLSLQADRDVVYDGDC